MPVLLLRITKSGNQLELNMPTATAQIPTDPAPSTNLPTFRVKNDSGIAVVMTFPTITPFTADHFDFVKDQTRDLPWLDEVYVNSYDYKVEDPESPSAANIKPATGDINIEVMHD